MLLVRGHGGGTALTGTIYERGETAPTFRGAPDEQAPYVWVCDEFYEVESGGAVQRIDGRDVNVAFESPMPRGFDTREQAVAAASDHIRTQFARVGVRAEDVTIEVVDPDEDTDGEPGGELEPVGDPDAGGDGDENGNGSEYGYESESE